MVIKNVNIREKGRRKENHSLETETEVAEMCDFVTLVDDGVSIEASSKRYSREREKESIRGESRKGFL